MYEAWAHNPQALEKRHKKNYKGVYSSVYPETWEFRNAQEVTDKVSKIHQFIYDYYSSFLELRATDEYIASVGFNSINELPPSFRVLQIIAFGNLHQTENIEVLLSYYKGKNFGTSGSKFAKLVETYGDQLHAHFN